MKYFSIEDMVFKKIGEDDLFVYGYLFMFKNGKHWRPTKSEFFIKCIKNNVIYADQIDISNLIEYSG